MQFAYFRMILFISSLCLIFGLIVSSCETTNLSPSVSAGSQGESALFAHDNSFNNIVKIDTSTGLASVVGPTVIPGGMTGMATSRGPVSKPGGGVYPSGTYFGLWGDRLVVVDVTTGEAFEVVKTSRFISARGIAFGPDGVTLYIIEGTGFLSTLDTVTGTVTLIKDIGYPSASLEWDPANVSFIAISGRSLIRIDPSDASVTVLGDLGVNACTIARSPAGIWYTINNSKELVTIDMDTAIISSVIGNLGSARGSPCGMTFAPERPLINEIEVAVDIKPHSCPNPIKINTKNHSKHEKNDDKNDGEEDDKHKEDDDDEHERDDDESDEHKGHGVLPVAILGTQDFDVRQIDVTTIRLLGVSPLRSELEDEATPFYPFIGKIDAFSCTTKEEDGLLDLTLKFDKQKIIDGIRLFLGREPRDREVITLSLTGKLKSEFGGTGIVGEDLVIVLNKKGYHHDDD